MLFDVPAFSVSVALGPVAEAFGVHEIAAYGIVSSGARLLPDADSALSIGAQPAYSLLSDVALTGGAAVSVPVSLPAAPPISGPTGSTTSPLYGSRLLEQIAILPAEQVGAFIRSNPDALQGLAASPPPARELSVWWTALQTGARTALLSQAPAVLGNLEGIPYPVRDVANRTVLNSTIAGLQTTVTSENGRTIVERAKQQLTMLASISDALHQTDGQNARRSLLTLDVTGQGRAAIVVGDLTTADYVSYLVPGMFFTIEGQMSYWTDAASRLRDEELAWLARFGEPDGTVATVAWIGYHTPNLTNVGSIDNAVEASRYIAETVQGLQAVHTGAAPFVSMIAHSYGSTAAMLALQNDDISVDALAVVGSPGSPAKSVDDLHVKNGNVYVGEAPFDPVPHTAFFGSDPGAPSFGARLFGTAGGTDPITGEALGQSFFHIEYFAPGTESLRNLSLIAIGRGADVTAG